MKTRSLLGALLLVYGSLSAAITTETTTVYFASDSANISEETANIIETFINDVAIKGDYEFQIVGHTDQEGDYAYNDELSAKRAFAIRDILIAKGMKPDACVIESFGKRRLLYEAYDQNSMAKNRRVDILFKRFHFENLEDVQSELSRSSKNTFIISPQYKHVLECTNGTLVAFDSNSFTTPDGVMVTEPIQIDIIEALSYGDMLSSKLTTWSDERILQTGGMAQISATTLSGVSLMLAEGAGLNIALPLNGTPIDGMQLFLSPNGQNWSATDNLPLTQTVKTGLEKPAFSYSKIDYPKFEIDESLAPFRPVEPSYPRSPTRPRTEGYFMPYKWYQFLNRKKLEGQYTARYQHALSKYGQKLEHYDAELTRFEKRCEKYPEYLQTYYEDLSVWNIVVNDMRTEFYEKQMPELKRIEMLKYTGQYDLYEKELQEWSEKRIVELNKYQMAIVEMGVPPGQSMNYYLFENVNLGWVNCDKFYDVPEEQKIDVIAEIESEGDVQVILVFPENQIMLSFHKMSSKYFAIKQIPNNLNGIVLSYKVENGELLVGQHPYKGQKKMKIDYEPMRLAEFRKLIQNLNISV